MGLDEEFFYIKALFLRKKNSAMREIAAHKLRFMSVKKVELPDCIHSLEKLLKPDWLKAVLLAISSGKASNLPRRFKTSFRILTATQKKLDAGDALQVTQMPKVQVCSLEQIYRLVEEAAGQFSSLQLSYRKDSSTCTLVIGKNREVS
jgi:hypothetical protein